MRGERKTYDALLGGSEPPMEARAFSLCFARFNIHRDLEDVKR